MCKGYKYKKIAKLHKSICLNICFHWRDKVAPEESIYKDPCKCRDLSQDDFL